MQLRTKFSNKVNIIDYAKMVKAIPKEWYKVVKKQITTETEKNAVVLVKDEIRCSKIVNDYLINKRENIRSQQVRAKWEEVTGCEITVKQWENFYKNTKILTNSTKLQFFQF